MFPLQQGNELCFKISSDLYEESKITQQDLIQLGLTHSSLLLVDSSHVTTKMAKTQQGAQNHRGRHHHHHRSNLTSHDNTKKKMVHREIERQRRQEMATRCSSLRSLLPLEYVKGKRSVSDHMNEAVNYIKQLQKNLSVLGGKRDELRKLSNLKGHDVVAPGHSESSSCSYSPCHVMVSPSAYGFEILMSLRQQDFPLSRVLELLLAEGLVVVSCCSTKVNERLLHTIQAEVIDSSTIGIDPSRLQEKLREAMYSSIHKLVSD